jgi:hypothetical protein
MGILAMKILSMWFLASVLTGLALGAVIRRGDRLHKDVFLTALFATLARLQESPQILNPASRIAPTLRRTPGQSYGQSSVLML